VLNVTSALGVGVGSGAWVTANATFGASGTASTMTMSGSQVTVTLGTASAGVSPTAVGATQFSWTTSNGATDQAGNACAQNSFTQPAAVVNF
ncbi:MAG: hypothetical protein JOZ68_18985, partial [Acidimicrobiia bacterium]|nr:hypothetical protein [Acidimicrobiia bacterium]